MIQLKEIYFLLLVGNFFLLILRFHHDYRIFDGKNMFTIELYIYQFRLRWQLRPMDFSWACLLVSKSYTFTDLNSNLLNVHSKITENRCRIPLANTVIPWTPSPTEFFGMRAWYILNKDISFKLCFKDKNNNMLFYSGLYD